MLHHDPSISSDPIENRPENHGQSTTNLLSSRGQTIEAINKLQKDYFDAGHTRPWETRDKNLRLLLEAIQDNKERILAAAAKDLGKPETESFITEYGFSLSEIRNLRKNLKRWMKPKRINPGILISPGKTRIVSEPLGQVLIIGPWNYPIQLVLAPLVGAIAAGNCAVVKPSELTPNCSKLICDILGEIFSEELIAVFEGGAQTSKELLNYRWDHIFFTGSTKVGRSVAERAAKTLSPTTLELGGKSPCIVSEDCNLKLAARRVTWGKFMNAGQTCVAPDYVLVHHNVKSEFLKLCTANVKQFYGEDPMKSRDYGRIVSKQHCERLVNFVESGRVYHGGVANIEERYLSPTIMDIVDDNDPLMQEEIFGPIMPVIAYDNIADVIKKVREKERPLALYLFAKDEKVIEDISRNLSFGGGCINDTIMQLVNHNMPFGGVGSSGIGSYHGPFSFDTFSHKKALVVQNSWFDIPLRYPPFNKLKAKVFEGLLG